MASNDLAAINTGLEPARLDLHSVKVQMTLGIILMLLACLASYGKCLPIGFLLDDFLHIDYCYRALRGDAHDLLHNFYGNWGGSDLMQSYRPLVSLSLFIDCVLFGAQAYGFHLVNILQLFACSALVGLIALEISGLWGNRLGAAAGIWSGLLFAVYPLHAESVAWITGRVDILCAVFFLAAVFCYLRFRLIREPAYLWSSLLCFALALTSKEMAVVLPVVLTAAEFCLPFPQDLKAVNLTQQKDWRNRLFRVMPFWAVLGMYMTLRIAILGTAVGGYNGLSLVTTWRNLLDKYTVWKLLFPANEEVTIAAWLKPALLSAYAAVAAMGLLRLLRQKTLLGVYAWLLAWIVIGVLPAFQIWHVFPNLVGSRLFFLSSAPACILLTLLALPVVDALSRLKLRGLTGLGLSCLLLIYVSWSLLLAANLKPWQIAGRQMAALRAQVKALAEKSGQRVLLLDLPSDYSGAGMLTRAQYLAVLTSPPLAGQANSGKFLTIEPPVGGSHEYVWPGQFQNILNHPQLLGVWRFDKAGGRFMPWKPSPGESKYEINLAVLSPDLIMFEPNSVTFSDGVSWTARSAGDAFVEKTQDGWRIHPGAAGLDMWFPPTSINPLLANVATIAMATPRDPLVAGKIQLIWKTASSARSQAAISILNGQPVCWLGRYRSWLFNGTVSRVGLHFQPGDYVLGLKGLQVQSAENRLPSFQIQQNRIADPFEFWEYHPGNQKLSFDYAVQSIAGASAVKLLVTAKNCTFDANSEGEVAEALPVNSGAGAITEVLLADLQGVVSLPAPIYQQPGLHQARIVAFDAQGRQVGLPSEPITFMIGNTSSK